MRCEFGPALPGIDGEFHIIEGSRKEFYASPDDGKTILVSPELNKLLGEQFPEMPGIPAALVQEFRRDRRTAVVSLYDPQTGDAEKVENLDPSELMFVKFVPGGVDKILILNPEEYLAMQQRLSLTSQAN